MAIQAGADLLAMGPNMPFRLEKQSIDRVREAVDRRDRFLDKRPELRCFQEEIDRRLKNAGSLENRMAVLAFMIHEHILEFDRALGKLKETWR